MYQNHNGNHWPHSVSGFIYFEFDIMFGEEGDNNHIQVFAPNEIFIILVHDIYDFILTKK